MRLPRFMRSLRARIALLLVGAILAVVVLAALVSIQMLERPDRSSFHETFAEEVRIVATLLGEDPDAARRLDIKVGPEPREAPGLLVEERRRISRHLAREGLDIPLRMVIDVEGRARQLAFEFAPGRWAYLPYIGLPPRNWPVFVAYLALVVLGSAAIALFVAGMMTRPFRLLERAIATVGPDGLPAPLPETGPLEVRQTAMALNRLTARVKAGVESRMRLVAAAGHDLRTPMTRMRLRAEFLPEDERETWFADLAEIDRIADSAIRLVREEVDPERSEKVALRALMSEIADELAEIGHDAAFEEAGPPDLVVAGRPLALKRALRNLMENAAMHGGAACAHLERETGAAIVVIEDEGPGIPPELLDRAFEPFFRVDPGRRHSKPGAGLGMAIAKEIVEKMGGSITIENRQQGGLRQTVRLPLAT